MLGKGRDAVILERKFVPAKSMIMRQGEEGVCAFLVQSGSVQVFLTQEDGSEVELARMGTGQIFGEMALVFDAPRTASVRAVEDCNLIVITRKTFMDKLNRSDPTVKAMVEMLSRRLIDINATLANKKSDFEDLNQTVNAIFQNVAQSLPRGQQRLFQNAVLPKLKEFLDALRAFRDRYDGRGEGES
ncbi:MAG: cyclic nucleotide-binding domain-containing protein [Rhodospirillales bacterium]|nr:cyclic nucleotide-binding domain-containing protein [Rhodospirillales bacterium]